MSYASKCKIRNVRVQQHDQSCKILVSLTDKPNASKINTAICCSRAIASREIVESLTHLADNPNSLNRYIWKDFFCICQKLRNPKKHN